jgi:hypothetical protein
MGKKGVKCILFTLLVFSALYGGLVAVYRLGGMVEAMIAMAVLSGLAIFFLFKALKNTNERTSNYYGVLSALCVWGTLGELSEHLLLFDLAAYTMFPLLAAFTFFVIFLGVKRYLPNEVMFMLGFFLINWLCHSIMIAQYDLLGRSSWITYPSCAIFLVLTVFFAYKMKKSTGDSMNMAYALLTLICAWSVLEYIWGWRLIPGPYSI